MTEQIRNVAIIAHVDHGKTTLVDHLLRQSGTFKEHEQVGDRIMDSNDLERERGITIMSKNTAVMWEGTKINIVDTPGHADFGGEVERILGMVNGVLLLVDAAEGPLPQTRFVLRKSLQLGYRPIVVLNKIDRHDARPEEVLNEVFDLFVELDADDRQLDFPVIYAVGLKGIATYDMDVENNDLTPVFESILKYIPTPDVQPDAGFKMLVSSVDWNDYVGRIAIGRVEQGALTRNQQVTLLDQEGSARMQGRATKLFTFRGLGRVPVEQVESGDVVAVAGYNEVDIGNTLTDSNDLTPVEYGTIDRPTLSMFFGVNDSPFAGQDGEFVTSNQLKDRLFREQRANVSLDVQPTEHADVYSVAGRGELQLAILVETMRREGYEFSVSRPEVVIREIDGVKHEPVEEVIVDVPEEYSNKVIDHLLQRRGQLENMTTEGDNSRLSFTVPSRGLIGFRSELLSETRGMAMIHQRFSRYEPYKGEMEGRNQGALIAQDQGAVTHYALESIQDRGEMVVEPGDHVYGGQVIGINHRNEDLVVNVVKKKNLTNHRATQSADAVKLNAPRKMSLEQYMQFIAPDELLEVTPNHLRMRKKLLDPNMRKRQEKKAAAAQ